MRSTLNLCTSLALLGLVPLVLAHGSDHENAPSSGEEMSMGGGHDGDQGHAHGHTSDEPKAESEYPPTYFALADHAGMMYAHIGLMVLAWVFLLPGAIMFSLARSRYTLALQLVFLAANVLGVLFAIIYNASTPDLYPNNAHHKVGWIAAAVAVAQVIISLMGHVAGLFRQSQGSFERRGSESCAFLPVSEASIAERDRIHGSQYAQPGRLSNDSGQGTEPNTESLRSHSFSSSGRASPRMSCDGRKEYAEPDDDFNEDGSGFPIMSMNEPKSIFERAVVSIPSRVWKGLMLTYNVIDRAILILGFIAFCLGIVAYGRFFEGRAIFGGLAHWIKGGVFFWLGIFTLGRWSGSFGEMGWAWNVRPKQTNNKWRPSAEFVESFLIFFYGSTNIFLEHLGNAGKAWRAQDLEHVSITVLFIGGGLLGMLIESTRIRDLLNTTVVEATETHRHHAYHDEERRQVDSHDEVDSRQEPKQYEFSINPIPALVILLLGIMMSSHQQKSMISSMIHKQWGNLLTGASLARGLTYVLLYLKPPRSVYPSRPPTELLASFGLIAGGVIFMASSSDTVEGMIHYQLDAMFMYTVTMGLVGLLMAWVITLLAMKGWAVRKEAAARRKVLH